MRRLQDSIGARAGWVRAPSTIELEIRTVWQEDEMPDELKSAPGWTSFSLGADSQAWVDSMAEVVDGGNAVYGRPRPIVPASHRSLTTPPPQPPPISTPIYTVSPAARVQIQPPAPPRRLPMPEIAGAPATAPKAREQPPARTLPKRVPLPEIGSPEPSPRHTIPSAMPDIGAPTTTASRSEHTVMPDIGAVESRHTQASSLPEIGTSDSTPAAPTAMPDIGRPQGPRAKSSHSAMPEIGDEETPDTRKPPRMPEIG